MNSDPDKKIDQDIQEIYTVFSETALKDCGISPDTRVLAAVSGGADSVCMLLLLNEYLAPGNLGAAHFNHSLRGPESDRDQAFAEELAKKLGIEFYTEKKDVAALSASEGSGTEECGRKYRYGFLKETAEKNGYRFVATAHNMGDNAETVLMHIFRGCSVDGLCGIPFSDGNTVRPMLRLDRRSIEAYLAYKGQDYVTDSSNVDNTYFRNRVRNEILPFLNEKLGYDIAPVLVRQTDIASQEKDFLDKAAEDFMKSAAEEAGGNVLIRDVDALNGLHGAVALRAVRLAVSSVKDADGALPYGGRKDINSDVVRRVLKLAGKGEKGKKAECGKGVEAVLTHSGLLFRVPKAAGPETDAEKGASAEAGFSVRTLSREEAVEMFKNGSFKAEKDRVFFDKEKYISIIDRSGGKAPVMRNIEAGDHIIPFGMKGRKKVRKLLIDRKIPLEIRSSIQVLALGSEVLWIPGACATELLRISPENEDNCGIIEISLRRDDCR